MKLTDEDLQEILKIKLELYDSVATIDAEKLMKYIGNDEFNTLEKVQDTQEYHVNGMRSSLNQFFRVSWFAMAEDEFNRRKQEK